MYHLELRQFPHNFCHFNLTEQALRETVLDAWARGESVEVGERLWNPQQANLIVIEGPELPVDQLSMGRGWRNALRQGTDVTAELLAGARARLGLVDTAPADVPGQAKEPAPGTARSAWAAVVGPASGRARGSGQQGGAVPGGGATGPGTSLPGGGAETGGQTPAEEVLARQLLSLLGENPGPLLRAWQLALEQHPDRTPSQCLALAEDFVRR
ncbi:MAG: hypothetical protein WBV85_10430 [Solirubrobacteraceae bacterium]